MSFGKVLWGLLFLNLFFNQSGNILADEPAQKSLETRASDSDCLLIVPNSIAIAPGATIKFRVQLPKNRKAEPAVPVEWQAATGKVETDGSYRAPEKPGKYLIKASIPGYEATATIMVRNAPADNNAKKTKHLIQIKRSIFKPIGFTKRKLTATIKISCKGPCRLLLQAVDRNSGEYKLLDSKDVTNNEEVVVIGTYNAFKTKKIRYALLDKDGRLMDQQTVRGQ